MTYSQSGSSHSVLTAPTRNPNSLESLSEERVTHLARMKAGSSGSSPTEEMESCVRAAIEDALSEHRRVEAAPSPLLKRDEAAEVLNISLRHLDTLVATGEITPVRIGRSVRFRPETLRAFIEEASQQ